MDSAKIRLSAKEMELVTNAGWILTKNAIIEKTKTLFGLLSERMTDHLNQLDGPLPMELKQVSPKISKGENYRGLPYLILDYPRLFEKDDILAVRTLFWWGNFFSITLQLSGRYKTRFEKHCLDAQDELSTRNFYACIQDGEWEHHFEPSNYRPVTGMNPIEWQQLIQGKTFIKIARKYDLQDWDKIDQYLLNDFRYLTGIMMR